MDSGIFWKEREFLVWKCAECVRVSRPLRTGISGNRFSRGCGCYLLAEDNVKDVSVVLEANGDSYSGFERVSASTGLPTILGWYVHEWLWRNNTDDLNVKRDDVETIYTGTDQNQIQSLLREYEVSYIFVGSKEREKYEDRLNNDMLKSLGEIVFADEKSDTYIVQVD